MLNKGASVESFSTTHHFSLKDTLQNKYNLNLNKKVNTLQQPTTYTQLKWNDCNTNYGKSLLSPYINASPLLLMEFRNR